MKTHSYIEKPASIKISKSILKRHSLNPKDFRTLFPLSAEAKKLSSLIAEDFQGQEIGSEAYIKKSSYRFLKTVNINSNFVIDKTSIEYCIPSNDRNPQNGNLLIVKDGAGDGLGEVCLYNIDNSNLFDSISAGVLAISITEKLRYYILGILKCRHFKDFINLETPEGSTIRHSKKVALDYLLPFPSKRSQLNYDDIIMYVSLLVQNIIHKEEQIKINSKQIDNLINSELSANQNPKTFQYNIATIKEISKNNLRFDSGMYSKEYKQLKFFISNYSNGFFNIPLEKLKSGSTPDIRIFGKKAKYKWVTPTNISDHGFFNLEENISMPTDNNLNSDAVLFINRTSKGKKGEYVGIACLYDYSHYGAGQHNQGIYRLEDYTPFEKQFIVAFMNAAIMRKICGYTSLGTKMKEMKMNDFSNLIFPNFHDNKKREVAKEYYNQVQENTGLTLDNYLTKEKRRNEKLGIFQLSTEITKLRFKLAELVDKIIKEEKINIDFN